MESIMMTLNQAELFTGRYGKNYEQPLSNVNESVPGTSPIEKSRIEVTELRYNDLSIKVKDYYCRLSADTSDGRQLSSANVRYLDASSNGKLAVRARKNSECDKSIDPLGWTILYQDESIVPIVAWEINKAVKSLMKQEFEAAAHYD